MNRKVKIRPRATIDNGDGSTTRIYHRPTAAAISDAIRRSLVVRGCECEPGLSFANPRGNQIDIRFHHDPACPAVAPATEAE